MATSDEPQGPVLNHLKATNGQMPDDVEADDGGGRMDRVAIPALSWQGSISTFTGGFSSSKSSLTMNSTDSISDDSISRFMVTKGARGRRASASREIRGGRRVVVDSGGAEQ